MPTPSLREGIAEARERLSRLAAADPATLDLAHESLAMARLVQRLSLAEGHADERRQAERIGRLVEDEPGLAFTTALTDQVFRTGDPGRVAAQVQHLLATYGIPAYLSASERFLLRAFRVVGPLVPGLSVPAVIERVARETRSMVLPGEEEELARHLAALTAEGARVNLNHLGEAILGEDEALARLETYLRDLARPHVTSVSVKISSVFSQLEVLAWDATVASLAERLGRLVRTAADAGGAMVYVDMEEYRDLHLTVAAFERVLDDPDLADATAGLVLQAYLPDSWAVQQELTAWARARVARGGAPVRLRIVKGANLAMERVSASLQGWPQAPYRTKHEVDANFKRMAAYGVERAHAEAVRLGVASHNVLDLAHALVLRAVAGTEDLVGFEMLEGMAEPTRRVMQAIAGDVLVYAPAVAEDEMQSAIAYLIRRFDENTGEDNFLGRCATAHPDSDVWKEEERRFLAALEARDEVAATPRRTQDRRAPAAPHPPDAPFANEPDTDWALAHNRAWIHERVARQREAPPAQVPLVIAGETIASSPAGEQAGADPSRPGHVLYRAVLADEALLDRALDAARAAAVSWGARTHDERAAVLAAVAGRLRDARGDLIACMLADGGKAIAQADPEVSEAIDFAEYYPRSLTPFLARPDLDVRPRGVVVVAPPWNFPLAIPAGGVLAALAAGNAVILKPAREARLVGWRLAELCWEAGVPRDVLQLLAVDSGALGSRLVTDPRVDAVVLTGGTDTARRFLELRPDLPLFAETGGKNAIIVTALSDRDLAIKHVVASAFGHSGQKCSAASLLICEAEVYRDESFLRRLADAARSLHVGSAWDPRSVVTPLIHPPRGALERGLTTLEPGETWLLQPRPHPDNPALWSPGIKLGVQPGGFTHLTELFGPVLGVMRADDLEHALHLANAVPYGLTAGLQSLDPREHARWIEAMDAGNLYVNRGTTGAIVRRQPFGGRKASSFGPGAKAGGPNYALQLCRLRDAGPPVDRADPDPSVRDLLARLARRSDAAWNTALIEAAEGYAHAWHHHVGVEHDPSRLLGQDNVFRYQPCRRVALRVAADAPPAHVARALVAAETCGVPAVASVDPAWPEAARLRDALGETLVRLEPASDLAARLPGEVDRVRALGTVDPALRDAARAAGLHLEADPPLVCGRVELLRWVREQAISVDYHRYGNLGVREEEPRAPVR